MPPPHSTVTSAQDPQSFVQFALSLLDHVKSIRLSREGKEKVQKGRLTVTQSLEKLQHSQIQEQRKEDKKKAEKEKMLNEPDPEITRKWEVNSSKGAVAMVGASVLDGTRSVEISDLVTHDLFAKTYCLRDSRENPMALRQKGTSFHKFRGVITSDVPRIECVTQCTVEQTCKVFDQGTIFSVKICGGLKYNVGICSFKPTMEGSKRMLAKPTVWKEPVTANILKAMVEATRPEPPLSDVRLLAVCFKAFAGFLHCNELIKLKCSDITFNAEGIVINVLSSETDQYRECASLVTAHTGTDKLKKGESLHNAGGLSYSRLRELLLDKIAKLGFDPALFGMHSLPAGGAIAAANAGVQDTLFKWHGCWKSESAKDGYGKDSAQRWLEVSKGLGI
ncbi:hypothetical protein EMCRGX_G013184 [Ephydatia muelleri]